MKGASHACPVGYDVSYRGQLIGIDADQGLVTFRAHDADHRAVFYRDDVTWPVRSREVEDAPLTELLVKGLAVTVHRVTHVADDRGMRRGLCYQVCIEHSAALSQARVTHVYGGGAAGYIKYGGAAVLFRVDEAFLDKRRVDRLPVAATLTVGQLVTVAYSERIRAQPRVLSNGEPLALVSMEVKTSKIGLPVTFNCMDHTFPPPPRAPHYARNARPPTHYPNNAGTPRPYPTSWSSSSDSLDASPHRPASHPPWDTATASHPPWDTATDAQHPTERRHRDTDIYARAQPNPYASANAEPWTEHGLHYAHAQRFADRQRDASPEPPRYRRDGRGRRARRAARGTRHVWAQRRRGWDDEVDVGQASRWGRADGGWVMSATRGDELVAEVAANEPVKQLGGISSLVREKVSDSYRPVKPDVVWERPVALPPVFRSVSQTQDKPAVVRKQPVVVPKETIVPSEETASDSAVAAEKETLLVREKPPAFPKNVENPAHVPEPPTATPKNAIATENRPETNHATEKTARSAAKTSPPSVPPRGWSRLPAAAPAAPFRRPPPRRHCYQLEPRAGAIASVGDGRRLANTVALAGADGRRMLAAFHDKYLLVDGRYLLPGDRERARRLLRTGMPVRVLALTAAEARGSVAFLAEVDVDGCVLEAAAAEAAPVPANYARAVAAVGNQATEGRGKSAASVCTEANVLPVSDREAGDGVTPILETTAVKVIPATETKATKVIPATETKATKVIPATETKATKVIPATETKATKVIPATETKATKVTPSTETKSTKVTPSTETKATKVTPSTETKATKVTPATETKAAKVTPSTETKSTKVTPSTETKATKVTPSTETKATKVTPSTETKAAKVIPGTETKPTKVTPATEIKAATVSPTPDTSAATAGATKPCIELPALNFKEADGTVVSLSASCHSGVATFGAAGFEATFVVKSVRHGSRSVPRAEFKNFVRLGLPVRLKNMRRVANADHQFAATADIALVNKREAATAGTEDWQDAVFVGTVVELAVHGDVSQPRVVDVDVAAGRVVQATVAQRNVFVGGRRLDKWGLPAGFCRVGMRVEVSQLRRDGRRVTGRVDFDEVEVERFGKAAERDKGVGDVCDAGGGDGESGEAGAAAADAVENDSAVQEVAPNGAIVKDAAPKVAVAKNASARNARAKDSVRKGAMTKNAEDNEAALNDPVEKDEVAKDSAEKIRVAKNASARNARAKDSVKKGATANKAVANEAALNDPVEKDEVEKNSASKNTAPNNAAATKATSNDAVDKPASATDVTPQSPPPLHTGVVLDVAAVAADLILPRLVMIVVDGVAEHVQIDAASVRVDGQRLDRRPARLTFRVGARVPVGELRACGGGRARRATLAFTSAELRLRGFVAHLDVAEQNAMLAWAYDAANRGSVLESFDACDPGALSLAALQAAGGGGGRVCYDVGAVGSAVDVNEFLAGNRVVGSVVTVAEDGWRSCEVCFSVIGKEERAVFLKTKVTVDGRMVTRKELLDGDVLKVGMHARIVSVVVLGMAGYSYLACIDLEGRAACDFEGSVGETFDEKMVTGVKNGNLQASTVKKKKGKRAKNTAITIDPSSSAPKNLQAKTNEESSKIGSSVKESKRAEETCQKNKESPSKAVGKINIKKPGSVEDANVLNLEGETFESIRNTRNAKKESTATPTDAHKANDEQIIASLGAIPKKGKATDAEKPTPTVPKLTFMALEPPMPEPAAPVHSAEWLKPIKSGVPRAVKLPGLVGDRVQTNSNIFTVDFRLDAVDHTAIFFKHRLTISGRKLPRGVVEEYDLSRGVHVTVTSVASYTGGGERYKYLATVDLDIKNKPRADKEKKKRPAKEVKKDAADAAKQTASADGVETVLRANDALRRKLLARAATAEEKALLEARLNRKLGDDLTSEQFDAVKARYRKGLAATRAVVGGARGVEHVPFIDDELTGLSKSLADNLQKFARNCGPAAAAVEEEEEEAFFPVGEPATGGESAIARNARHDHDYFKMGIESVRKNEPLRICDGDLTGGVDRSSDGGARKNDLTLVAISDEMEVYDDNDPTNDDVIVVDFQAILANYNGDRVKAEGFAQAIVDRIKRSKNKNKTIEKLNRRPKSVEVDSNLGAKVNAKESAKVNCETFDSKTNRSNCDDSASTDVNLVKRQVEDISGTTEYLYSDFLIPSSVSKVKYIANDNLTGINYIVYRDTIKSEFDVIPKSTCKIEVVDEVESDLQTGACCDNEICKFVKCSDASDNVDEVGIVADGVVVESDTIENYDLRMTIEARNCAISAQEEDLIVADIINFILEEESVTFQEISRSFQTEEISDEEYVVNFGQKEGIVEEEIGVCFLQDDDLFAKAVEARIVPQLAISVDNMKVIILEDSIIKKDTLKCTIIEESSKLEDADGLREVITNGGDSVNGDHDTDEYELAETTETTPAVESADCDYTPPPPPPPPTVEEVAALKARLAELEEKLASLGHMSVSSQSTPRQRSNGRLGAPASDDVVHAVCCEDIATEID